MFSGIGGFELGILHAYGSQERGSKENTAGDETQRLLSAQGEDIDSKDGRIGQCAADELDQRPLCVGYSEIDKYAIQIYEQHFKGHKNYGNATTIRAESLPDFDFLCGGFPCQAFSVAGQRGGFEDTRGTLFFEIARILKEKQPRMFLLENVKGLLSHDNGRSFKTIIATLVELGYGVEWQVLNSKNFGVPQNRERVFIVGHLGGECRRKIFPISGDHAADNQSIVSTAIDSNYFKGIDNHGQRTNIGVCPTIRATHHKSGDNQTVVAVGTLRTHKDGEGFREIKSGLSPTIPARAREDGSGQPIINQDMRIRRLTPTECERLQGFPDGWTKGISDTQRYKCLGNAVTVNVIKTIMKRIIAI